MATPIRTGQNANVPHAPPSSKVEGEMPERPYEEVPADQLADEIEHISPEGRPGEPRMGPRQIGLLIGGLAILVLAGGIAAMALLSVAAGLFILALGIALLIANPVVWASIGRASERAEAKHRIEGHPTRPTTSGSSHRA